MTGTLRTSIGLKNTTKARLNVNRAPGQCYDGFLCQLIDLWEKLREGRILYVADSAGENQGAVKAAPPNSSIDSNPLP